MDNPQQYYPQTPMQQMPPTQKPMPLYKKWFCLFFVPLNIIAIIFLCFYTISLKEQLSAEKEKNEILSSSLYPLIDYNTKSSTITESLNQTFHLVDFLDINLDNIDNRRLYPHLTFYNYFIQSHLFYQSLVPFHDFDFDKSSPLLKRYLLSAKLCISVQYDLGNIDDVLYTVYINNIDEYADTLEQLMSSKDLSTEQLKEILETATGIDATMYVFIEKLIDN